MSRIWNRHVSHMNESFHTYEWVISHIRMSHITHTNESCLTYAVISHIWMVQLMHACDMTYLQVIHICRYYGVATISRLLKIIGLFCRISSLFKGSFAKETYNFKEPTNGSHPITVPEQRLIRRMSHGTRKLSHGTHTKRNAWRHPYERVMSHTLRSQP